MILAKESMYQFTSGAGNTARKGTGSREVGLEGRMWRAEALERKRPDAWRTREPRGRRGGQFSGTGRHVGLYYVPGEAEGLPRLPGS